ncbi:MAG: xanthine dehydrogenase accessory protein XdhC [Deltaproteobacteria bacterium]|nr:MAG: xanthine dehydrogenase accessory protein XdhC [Deltaproteobacteria bacterium]
MEPRTAQDVKAFAQTLQKLIDEEKEGVLALVVRSVGSAPGRVGAKAVILPDGTIHGTVGGGVVEARVIADALDVLEDGRGPRTLHYKLDELGMSCGGQMSVYLEPLQHPKRIVVYGAGHVGQAVCRVMKLLGCRVTVIDDRPEWASRERFAEVDELLVLPFSEALEKHPPGERDHAIVVTRGHDNDQLVLEGIIDKGVAWIGVIGSRKKAAQIRQQLEQKGIDPSLVEKVQCPVGLDIGAVTPEEIAISIAAQLVAVWRRSPAAQQKAMSQPRPMPPRPPEQQK